MEGCQGLAACMRGVWKRLGGRDVLRGVMLSVEKGSVHVVAGLNGSGKTTSMRVLLGLYKPDKGVVRLLGRDPRGPGRGELMRRVGYVPEDAQPYERLTGLENLLFYARLYAGSEEEAWRLVEEAAKITGLDWDVLERQRAGSYSKGMKRRLLLAAALMHSPEILVADEPLSGLDAISAFNIRRLIKGLAGRGSTFIITTHDLRVAEELADRVTFIHAGRTVFEGTLREALNAFSADTLEEAFVRAVGSGKG